MLTKDQLAELDEDPANFMLSTGSHHLKLDYSQPVDAETAKGFLWAIECLEDLGLRDRVQQITVNGYGSLTNFTSMALGIQHITQLDELHWLHNNPMPRNVLSAVQDFHPGCKIYYTMKFWNWDPYRKDFEHVQTGDEPQLESPSEARRLILNSSNVHSLMAKIEYEDSPDPESLRLVHEIIITCPNLKALDLS